MQLCGRTGANAHLMKCFIRACHRLLTILPVVHLPPAMHFSLLRNAIKIISSILFTTYHNKYRGCLSQSYSVIIIIIFLPALKLASILPLLNISVCQDFGHPKISTTVLFNGPNKNICCGKLFLPLNHSRTLKPFVNYAETVTRLFITDYMLGNFP